MGIFSPTVPRNIRKHLAPGEGVVLVLHPSAWRYILHYLLGLILLGFSIVLPVFEAKAVAAISGILYIAYTELRRRRIAYVVTTHRIMKEARLFSRRSSTLPMNRITDVHLDQSFFGRLFNFGDLFINTAGEGGFELVMEKIPGPGDVKATIESQLLETRKKS